MAPGGHQPAPSQMGGYPVHKLNSFDVVNIQVDFTILYTSNIVLLYSSKRMVHTCVSTFCHHWFKWYFVAHWEQYQYLRSCWYIINIASSKIFGRNFSHPDIPIEKTILNLSSAIWLSSCSNWPGLDFRAWLFNCIHEKGMGNITHPSCYMRSTKFI